jgi:hypothetical protein
LGNAILQLQVLGTNANFWNMLGDNNLQTWKTVCRFGDNLQTWR